jgi:hypothetical protein
MTVSGSSAVQLRQKLKQKEKQDGTEKNNGIQK